MLKQYRGEHDTRTYNRPPTATLVTSGRAIRFNMACRRMIGEGFRYVQIYYEDEQSKIILKLCRPDDSHRYTITKEKTGGVVSCRGFLSWIGMLPIKKAQAYRCSYDISRRWLIIDLNWPIATRSYLGTRKETK